MTSHDESRRGARPPGADDGAEIKVYKRISRELGCSRSSYAPQSPRCEIYRGRYTIEVYLIPESEAETNETKKNRVLYSIRPVV